MVSGKHSTAELRLPNFLIIGAMRSGTTSLARYLEHHPDVFLAPQKEVHFFDANFDRGIGWYELQFNGWNGERAIGEATPNYLHDTAALNRIRETLPEARLLVILRNPIDRAYSHYWQKVASGRETLDFGSAIREEPNRLAQSADDRRNFSYLDRGKYLQQLEPVADLFGLQRMEVLLLEDLHADPTETFGRVCRFLEIDDSVAPTNLGRTMNGYVSFRSLRFRRYYRRLPTRFQSVFARLNRRQKTYPAMAPEIRKTLQEYYRSENAALGEWLGRDLHEWDERS